MYHLRLSLPFFIISFAAVLVWSVDAIYVGPSDTSRVLMISGIFRHGERSPRESYPTDPYINYTWYGGLGALTKKGALQHFVLGRKLRSRYYWLLSKDGQYTKENVLVKSSSSERCIMSAQSLLASFMAPRRSVNLLPINWQPVPIMTLPPSLDDLIAQQKSCDKYEEMYRDLFVNPPEDIKKLNDESVELYQYLSEHTGMSISNVWEAGLLYNTLQVQSDAGLTLPNWTKGLYPDKLKIFLIKGLELLIKTPYMQKVKGGSLISEVYRNMVQKQQKTLEPNRNIFYYSGHDITVLSVIRALDIVDQTSDLPDYASTLVFELHKPQSINAELEVKLVFYKNSEVKYLKEVNIPGCDDPCTLTKFGEAVKHLLYDDYDEICENKNPIILPPVNPY